MRNITVEELKSKMEAGHVHLIDVRELAEVEEYNLGGIHIPLANVLSMQVDEIENLKEEEIFVHCKRGGRSAQACLFLEQMGFTNVVNVQGGIDEWIEKFNIEK